MTPLLVTAAIILSKVGGTENILLVQNQKNLQKGCYGFPGGVGGFEKTSDPAKAVIEEVLGDTGCTFNGSFFTYSFRDGEVPVVTLFYIGKITGQPHPVCKNILDVKYFPVQEARKMNLAYEHNFILEKYLGSQDGER